MTLPETDQELIYVVKYVNPYQYEEIRSVTKSLTRAKELQKEFANKSFRTPIYEDSDETWRDGKKAALWTRADLRSYYTVEVYPVTE